MLHHIPTAEAQDLVFAELARVLGRREYSSPPTAWRTTSTRQFHVDDVYNPIDPDTLEHRMARAGFASIEVRVYDLGWICTAAAR